MTRNRIRYPSDPSTNEAEIYDKLKKEADCLPAVKAFVENLCRLGLPDEALPSLHDACRELVRIQS